MEIVAIQNILSFSRAQISQTKSGQRMLLLFFQKNRTAQKKCILQILRQSSWPFFSQTVMARKMGDFDVFFFEIELNALAVFILTQNTSANPSSRMVFHGSTVERKRKIHPIGSELSNGSRLYSLIPFKFLTIS